MRKGACKKQTPFKFKQKIRLFHHPQYVNPKDQRGMTLR